LFFGHKQTCLAAGGKETLLPWARNPELHTPARLLVNVTLSAGLSSPYSGIWEFKWVVPEEFSQFE
jgi:hypothetical protein